MKDNAQSPEILEIVAALEAAALALENLGAFAAAAYVSQSLDSLAGSEDGWREGYQERGGAG
ncbi:hypothetical protein [Novosphingobium olei]|uniref:Uncharacterized protein n=1 Tax=Novosphingobium olei TaxID=2728851 RepID=A0A7Y0GBL8_9SPHN|nr:hypothetical protein [Novosphingobium olei]NML96260.1 hypothetical protein [Novosphingobium olei]